MLSVMHVALALVLSSYKITTCNPIRRVFLKMASLLLLKADRCFLLSGIIRVTEQELLACVHALKIKRCYLEGAAVFRLHTDHGANTFLDTQPSLKRIGKSFRLASTLLGSFF